MQRKIFHTFSFAWTLASLLGAGIGYTLGWLALVLLQGGTETLGDSSLLSLLLLLPAVGLGMGLGQTWVLRGRIRRPGWWAVATFFAWLFGFSVDLTFRRVFSLPPWAVFAMIGLYLGVLQWLVIFRQVPYAAVWIVINPLVWALLYGLLALVNGMVDSAASVVLILTWAGIGGLYGLVTGPLLQWMSSKRLALPETA